MRILDGVRMAAGGLRERKLRTALTLLGIVIGTGMIVALEASTQGQSAAISSQLEKLGPTTLIVQVGGFGGNARNFTQNDIATVQGLDHVQTVFLAVEGDAQITRSGETDGVAVLGIEPADLGTLVKGLQIADGTAYQSGDLTGVVLGSTAATPTDTTKLPTASGESVRVSATVRQFTAQGRGSATTVTHTYVVTGVAAPFGSAPFVSVDGTVFMTPRAAQQLLNIPLSQYNEMVVLADSPDTVNAVQSEIQGQFTNARVLSGTQLASTISSVYGTISTLLGSIAAISLIVAGVGIANTMFVSVIERTTEIGTLKALGFKAREVLGVFLLEASLTGVAGGVLGCLMGVGVAYGIGSLLKFPGSTRRRLRHARPDRGPQPDRRARWSDRSRAGRDGARPTRPQERREREPAAHRHGVRRRRVRRAERRRVQRHAARREWYLQRHVPRRQRDLQRHAGQPHGWRLRRPRHG